MGWTMSGAVSWRDGRVPQSPSAPWPPLGTDVSIVGALRGRVAVDGKVLKPVLAAVVAPATGLPLC